MLDEIRAFLDVVAQGSLTRVANAREIAVSSVSRKIDLLEAELGTKLFNRTSRAIILTDAGEQFLPHARSMVSEMDEAKDAISSSRSDPRGLLTVTAPAAFGRRYVAPAIASFLQKYPQMEIDLHLSDQVIDLSAQRVDVAVRIGALPDSDLVATRLAPMQRLACASPDYIKRHGKPATPGDLIHHNCLKKVSHPLPTEWNFVGFNQNKPLPVKGTFRSDDIEGLLQAAISGIGIIHLASWLVSESLASGKLLLLFEPGLSDTQKNASAIHAVRMPGRSHAHKAQLFIAHLREVFGEPPYWDSVQ